MKKICVILIILMMIGLGFLSGCEDINKNITPLSIVLFTVEPSMINQSDYANLSWNVTGASSVSIDNGIGNVTLSGNKIIQPMQTTTYILTALNGTTTKSAFITITVKLPAVEPEPDTNATLTDTTGDVMLMRTHTGYSELTTVTSHPEINVDNLDIIKATYNQQGKRATLTLQVKGNIEDRGETPFQNPGAPLCPIYNKIDYYFELKTSGDAYGITYCNKTGWMSEEANIPTSVVGDTLVLSFSLSTAEETYENLIVTSSYTSDNEMLTDLVPNLPLTIYSALAETNIGFVGQSIRFSAEAGDFSGIPPYEYHWDFGDGTTSTQRVTNHTYTTAGNYNYTFTITDYAGDTERITWTIIIKPSV